MADDRNEEIAVQSHLARPKALRPRHILDVARVLRIGDVEDAPARLERVAHEDIPTTVFRVRDRKLERSRMPAEAREADQLQVRGFRSGWDWVGKGRRGVKHGSGQKSERDQHVAYDGHAELPDLKQTI